MSCYDSQCAEKTCSQKNYDTVKGCLIREPATCPYSKWVCRCNNRKGYYRLNPAAKDCVHESDISCQNMNCKSHFLFIQDVPWQSALIEKLSSTFF